MGFKILFEGKKKKINLACISLPDGKMYRLTSGSNPPSIRRRGRRDCKIFTTLTPWRTMACRRWTWRNQTWTRTTIKLRTRAWIMWGTKLDTLGNSLLPGRPSISSSIFGSYRRWHQKFRQWLPSEKSHIFNLLSNILCIPSRQLGHGKHANNIYGLFCRWISGTLNK